MNSGTEQTAAANDPQRLEAVEAIRRMTAENAMNSLIVDAAMQYLRDGGRLEVDVDLDNETISISHYGDEIQTLRFGFDTFGCVHVWDEEEDAPEEVTGAIDAMLEPD
ncbi:MAG: hypothetical protein KF699_00575 [Phycisphaeraceae bacterium]|nr:hypothetical protein [Phycisphaeraceae bacterium]